MWLLGGGGLKGLGCWEGDKGSMRGVRAHLEGVDAVVCGHVDEHLRRAVSRLKKERVALRNVHLGSSRDTDQQRGCRARCKCICQPVCTSLAGGRVYDLGR